MRKRSGKKAKQSNRIGLALEVSQNVSADRRKIDPIYNPSNPLVDNSHHIGRTGLGSGYAFGALEEADKKLQKKGAKKLEAKTRQKSRSDSHSPPKRKMVSKRGKNGKKK